MVGNLRAIANSVTRVINANVGGTLFISTGNVIGDDHVQVPSYEQTPVIAQVQPLSSKDVRQIDALNIQGVEKAVYLNGTALAIVRVLQLGGDLIVLSNQPEGTTWKILVSLEQWGKTWCKVGVILQDDDLSGSLITDLTDPGNEVIVPALLTGV